MINCEDTSQGCILADLHDLIGNAVKYPVSHTELVESLTAAVGRNFQMYSIKIGSKHLPLYLPTYRITPLTYGSCISAPKHGFWCLQLGIKI